MQQSRETNQRRSRLLQICGDLPEVETVAVGVANQHLAIRVRKKIFAYYLHDHHGDGRIALCCKAEHGEQGKLVEEDPRRFFVPAYLGPKGWVGVRLDLTRIDWDQIAYLVSMAYRMTAPKSVVTHQQAKPRDARSRTARIRARTIDEYLAALTEDKRAALEKLRQTIRAAAPAAEECISYQLPAFRLNGMLVAFGATANHCSFYLMSSSTVAAHADELRSYDTSKGVIRFQADKPMPAALVRKLVKSRSAENEGRGRKPRKSPDR